MNQPLSSPNSSPQPRPRKQHRTTPLHQAQSLRPLHQGPLPLDPTGQRLAHLFPNGWNSIYAPAPQPGDKPQWQTIKPFPLAPVEMWQQHQDPRCLIGIRPGSLNQWGNIDLDIHSPYHPQQDPSWLPLILSTLETIGITRTLICQSSHSQGIHIWIPLPTLLSSFWFAITLKYTLEALGLKLRPGHCEIFPNPKRYIPQGYSQYAALRLPMQPDSGYHLLDSDLNPLPSTLEHWLDTFDLCASHQDLNQLQKAIDHSQQNHRIRRHRHPQSLASWQQRIDLEKQQGWTGPGQSNEKFKLLACEARVFLSMDSPQAIAQHIQQSAQTTPGFYQHSNHTQDLTQRSQEIATWAMRYYWPLGSDPQRDTSYHTTSNPPANFSYHQTKRQAAQTRIQTALDQLQQQNNLPPTPTARAQAIAQIAHISQQTLYKPHNKPLWHPDHLPPPTTPPETPQPAPEQQITQLPVKSTQEPQSQRLKLLWLREITQLYIYVGVCILLTHLSAAAALTLKRQRAAKAAQSPTNNSNRGGMGGNFPASSPPPDQENSLLASAPSSLPPSPSAPPSNSHPGWSRLRAILPEKLQAKIAAAEQERERQQQREEQRRRLIEFRRSRPPVDTSPEALAALERELDANRLSRSGQPLLPVPLDLDQRQSVPSLDNQVELNE